VPDNFALLAAAIIDAQAGGRAEATRSCIQEVVREHPGVMYARLGVEPPAGVESPDATATHSVGLEIFDCLGAEEQLAYAVRIWSTETGVSTLTGQDLVDVLDVEQETCLRAKHGAAYDTLLTTTFLTIRRLPNTWASAVRSRPPPCSQPYSRAWPAD